MRSTLPEFPGAERTPESEDSGGSVAPEFSGAERTPESADSGGSVAPEFSGLKIDWTRCATVPRQHQKDGAIAIATRSFFGLMDEVGGGKSKQVVDAACVLFEQGLIDTVIVLAPAMARGVWADPNPILGEVAKHSWPSIPYALQEYSVRRPKIRFEANPLQLQWLVSNYEFIRREERLVPVLKWMADRKVLLVCDEGWALKDYGTDQWKATYKIRKRAARVVLLNGTPVADTPLDLFAQMKMLDEGITGIKFFSHFRARYAILKPNVSFPMITGWQNLEELRAKVEPHVLRRKTRDCFDLPPILDPVLIEARLSDVNWKIYCGMRDDMVAWLDSAEAKLQAASIAKQAIVRVLRLEQITSGFLGGITPQDIFGDWDQDPDELAAIQAALADQPTETREIGREKLDATIEWLKRMGSDAPQRILMWCKFRPEIERAADAFRALGRETHLLYGQQPRAEREAAKIALNPDHEPEGLVAVVGQPQAGGAALNLSGASLAINLSHESKLRVHLQAKGRIDRPGQKHPIRYADVVATGPKGQRTINHHTLASLLKKQDIAEWTTATWRKALLEE